MTSLLKSDIFFFVTTLCTIVLSAFLIAVFHKGYLILKHAEKIMKSLQNTTAKLEQDFDDVRIGIRDGEIGFRDFLAFLLVKSSKKNKRRV